MTTTIIASDAEVRAWRAGATSFRRPVKLREFGASDTPGYDWTFRDRRALWNDFRTADLLASKFAPWKPGDTLRVREAWATYITDERTGKTRVAYRASGTEATIITGPTGGGSLRAMHSDPVVVAPARGPLVDARDARIAELEREIEATWTALGVPAPLGRGVTLSECAAANVTLRKSTERERDEARVTLDRIRTLLLFRHANAVTADDTCKAVLRILNEGDV